MKARLIYAFLGLSLVTLPATSQSTRRWSPQEDGSITWNIRNDLPHSDHIEMSGKSVSVVLRYGVDREGNFTLNKGMVWPLLRTVPNNTHASLMRRSAWNPLDAVLVNSRSLTEEKVESISLNGILTVESRFDKGYYGQWKLIREYFPSTDQPALIEKYSLINTGKNSLQVETLWPLIQWCLEYCHRKLTPEGVVASDADELEGRFPAGKANLCTSSLYYDALISAAFLAKDLGKDKKTAATYRQQAADLRKSIEKYFGGTVEGYDTYHYYEGNDILRSWICIPLTVGISERKEGTIQALFSPRLWTENGLLTQAGDSTFWDRSTLYALRGVYAVGETEKATEYLKHYSSVRLLGEHVPYAIEAWPEGGQRHLSAESALYGRIITEGLFGIRPTGLKSCDVTPRLPQEWNQAALRRIRAFGSTFDITVERIRNGKLRVNIDGKSYTIREGETIHARLQ